MEPKKIIITGATGLIGKKLYKALSRRGDEVTIFTRSMVKGVKKIPGADELIEWDYSQKNHWQKHVSGKDVIIHLSGANLFGKRWTQEYKELIVESRRLSTKNLVDAMENAERKPSLFICASAVGYYGDRGNETITENSSPGNDYLAEVCKVWEYEAAKAEEYGIRRISVRTGIVLSKEEGALKQMLLPYKFFAGGPLGNGKQWFPWIHIDDIINSYLYCIDNENISGSINAAAPHPVTMNEFAKTLGKVIKRPSLFHVPNFALKIAVGESASAITASMKVIPEKLQNSGFTFSYPEPETALRSLLNK
jgi:uncharacterized protein (TIGR01777 family)